jgi:hypothetical protein
MEFDWPENGNSNSVLPGDGHTVWNGREDLEHDVSWQKLTRLSKRKWCWNKLEWREYVRVWIDVTKLDAMLRLVPSDYVGFAGENGILGKYTGVDDFVRSGKEALYMPKAGVRSHAGSAGDKIAYILDGRHRFAWMRDHGAQAIPVSAPADEALEIAKLVRTKFRVCRVTMRHIPEWRYDPINHVRL